MGVLNDALGTPFPGHAAPQERPHWEVRRGGACYDPILTAPYPQGPASYDAPLSSGGRVEVTITNEAIIIGNDHVASHIMNWVARNAWADMDLVYQAPAGFKIDENREAHVSVTSSEALVLKAWACAELKAPAEYWRIRQHHRYAALSFVLDWSEPSPKTQEILRLLT